MFTLGTARKLETRGEIDRGSAAQPEAPPDAQPEAERGEPPRVEAEHPRWELEETLDLSALAEAPGAVARDLPNPAGVAGSPEAPEIPELPDLLVLEKIGEGGFGVVYRARDLLLDRDVALKVARPRRPGHPATRAIFLREARALARIRHENVLTIHGVSIAGSRDTADTADTAGDADGGIVLVTEYVRGRSLEEIVAAEGPIDAAEAARIGVQICRALTAVHAAGLVHRDLKTENVVVETTGGSWRGGRVVLTDFGLGLATDARGDDGAPGEERHAPGDPRVDDLPPIAGSPLFMAPEQVRGDPVDPRTDIYALGVALYHIASGEYPVVRDELTALLAAIESDAIAPLERVRPDLPPSFTRAVSRALAKDPADRFQTAAEMEQALAGCAAEASAGER